MLVSHSSACRTCLCQGTPLGVPLNRKHHGALAAEVNDRRPKTDGSADLFSQQPKPKTNDLLIKSPSPAPRKRLFRSQRRSSGFGSLGLLFAGGEDALLVAANTFVRIQPFEHKLSGRNYNLRRIFWLHANCTQLLGQALNVLYARKHFFRRGVVAEANFAAEIEPLHHLMQRSGIEILIECLRHGGAN